MRLSFKLHIKFFELIKNCVVAQQQQKLFQCKKFVEKIETQLLRVKKGDHTS